MIYNGYTIEITTNGYKIIEDIGNGKMKVRRNCNCTTTKLRTNHYGTKFFKPFTSQEHALETAKNFIDNHIVKWSESKNNPITKCKNMNALNKEIKVGDRVARIPFYGAKTWEYQNGIVKSISDNKEIIFVVYHCNYDWANYKDYTGCATNPSELLKGWNGNNI